MTGTPSYNEAEIAGRLTALFPAARAMFACACAERLMTALKWYCELAGTGNFDVVREALDAAWTPGRTPAPAAPDDVIAAMPPGEDGDLYLGSAMAEDAVIAVAYSLEVRDDGAVQAAVWAARRLYVAADTVVQQGAAAYSYVENIEREPPVRLMVRGIYSALDGVGILSLADLQARAREDGGAFMRFVSL